MDTFLWEENILFVLLIQFEYLLKYINWKLVYKNSKITDICKECSR